MINLLQNKKVLDLLIINIIIRRDYSAINIKNKKESSYEDS